MAEGGAPHSWETHTSDIDTLPAEFERMMTVSGEKPYGETVSGKKPSGETVSGEKPSGETVSDKTSKTECERKLAVSSETAPTDPTQGQPGQRVTESDDQQVNRLPPRCFRSIDIKIKNNPQDTTRPLISSMAVSSNNCLYMVDSRNAALKILTLYLPSFLNVIYLQATPVDLAVLDDHNIVLTTTSNVLLFVHIHGRQRKVKTDRLYDGIWKGPDNTLIVSCFEGSDSSGRVDIIRLDGTLIRTVVEGNQLPARLDLLQLRVEDNCFLAIDCDSPFVYRVDITSGQIVEKLEDPDLAYCRQAAQNGHITDFIYCFRKHFFLIKFPQLQRKNIVEEGNQPIVPQTAPYAFCPTELGPVVSLWDPQTRRCKVYLVQFCE